jgi:metallo-beta-lactamase family protein
MELRFFGATGGTTGSCHWLRAGRETVLLECGQFQGPRAESRAKNAKFAFDPRAVDAVVLSHAHIDHSGKLPMLVRHGFKGPIHATRATSDLAEPMLYDAAAIQLRDAEYLNQRLMRERVRRARKVDGRRRAWGEEDDAPCLGPSNPPRREICPLYLAEDVRETVRLFRGHDWGDWFAVGKSFRFRFHDAGHILGASWVECEAREDGQTKRVVFTGDYGRPQPILRDPTPLAAGEVVISESTYGDRCHPRVDDTESALAAAVARLAERRRGKLLIPAFAVGRTQHVLYAIERIFEQRRLAPIPVVVDSPLAAKATEIVARHPECFDEEALARLTRSKRLRVVFTESVDESKALNRDAGPVIIVSASGMMESGRILHHLAWSISKPDTEIAIVGYQAQGTLGRRILEGAREVNILGMRHEVRARVTKLDGFSAHADRDGLIAALAPIAGEARALFLVHGEDDQRLPLALRLKERGCRRVECPADARAWRV